MHGLTFVIGHKHTWLPLLLLVLEEELQFGDLLGTSDIVGYLFCGKHGNSIFKDFIGLQTLGCTKQCSWPGTGWLHVVCLENSMMNCLENTMMKTQYFPSFVIEMETSIVEALIPFVSGVGKDLKSTNCILLPFPSQSIELHIYLRSYVEDYIYGPLCKCMIWLLGP